MDNGPSSATRRTARGDTGFFGEFFRGLTSMFGTDWWGLRLALIAGAFFIPVVGPLLLMGWCVERLRRVASGDMSLPPVTLTPSFVSRSQVLNDVLRPYAVMLMDGLAAAAGLLVTGALLIAGPSVLVGFAGAEGIPEWLGIVVFFLSLGALVLSSAAAPFMMAAVAHYAYFGRLRSFLDARGIVSAAWRGKREFFRMLVFIGMAATPAIVLAGAVTIAAMGEQRTPTLAIAAFNIIVGAVTLGSTYWLGSYMSAAYGKSPQASSALDFVGGFFSRAAEGLEGRGTGEDEGAGAPIPPRALPVGEPQNAEPREPDGEAAALPANAVAVLLPAAGERLGGQAILYEGGCFSIPALEREVSADMVMEFDRRGLLSWPREDVRKAVADMTTAQD